MTVLQVAINSDTDNGVEQVSTSYMESLRLAFIILSDVYDVFSQILHVGNPMRKLLIMLFDEVEESVYNITSFYGCIIEHWKLMALKDTINIIRSIVLNISIYLFVQLLFQLSY